jgi:hypothetical protein
LFSAQVFQCRCFSAEEELPRRFWMFQQQRYTAACGPAANLPRLCVLSPRLNCFAGAASRACEVDQFTKVITGWVPDMDSNSNSRVGSVGQNSRLISGRIAPCRLSLSCPKDHFPGRSGSNLDLVAHPAKLPFTYRAQRVHRPPQSESLLLVGPFKKRLFDKRPQSNWKHCRDDPSDPMLHHRKHRTNGKSLCSWTHLEFALCNGFHRPRSLPVG